MSHGESFTVLVAHHDPLAEAGLVALFSAHEEFNAVRRPIDRVDETVTEIDIGRCAVDVVVADYLCGIALSRLLVQQRGQKAMPKVVIVTASDSESEIRSAIERGVAGYLLIGTPLTEIVAGVRAVLRGARRYSAGVSERLAESLASERLTMREEDVLLLVVSGACNKVIARELCIAVGTVKSHLKSIFEKLRVTTRTQAVATATRRGLLRERSVHPERSDALAAAPAFAAAASRRHAGSHELAA